MIHSLLKGVCGAHELHETLPRVGVNFVLHPKERSWVETENKVGSRIFGHKRKEVTA